MEIRKFGNTFKTVWWKGESIGKSFSLDTETELIQGNGHIPKLVISCAYAGDDKIYLIKNNQIKDFLELHKTSTISFHSAAFDVKVLEKHTGFDFFDQIIGRKILDTAILYRLYYLAELGYEAPRYALDFCVKQMYKIELPKDNDIRLTFGQYIKSDGIDYNNMSKAHLEYAALDPVATWMVLLKLETKFKQVPTSNYCAHYIHLMGDLALDTIKNTGIGVDLEYVKDLRKKWQNQMDVNAKVLATYGLVRGQKGFQSRYESIAEFLELDLPRTGKSNKLSMSKEHLTPYKSEPFVAALLEYLELEKLKNFLNDLTEERVYPRYSSIKKTGRTSCSKPNIQNPPRVGGIREAFVPKEGHVFIDIDYSSIELYALAQVLKNLYNHSVLFDKLKEGTDVHIYAASKIYNISEEEVTKEQRQIAKICNYGLAANMSANTFMNHMHTNGVDIDLEGTRAVKKAWSDAFPEIKQFWKRGRGRQQFVSRTGFVRNNCSYTQYLNIHFQSLVAEGCKIMLYFVQRNGYKSVAFIHDQLVVEHPEEGSEKAMKDVQKIMEDAMQNLIPDLPIKTEGKITKRFEK